MVLYGLLGLASCDKISNNSEHLDDEYVGISSWVDDWSGDYIIAHKDGSSLIPYEDRHIIDAVENFNCPRRFPRQRYVELVKEADSDD